MTVVKRAIGKHAKTWENCRQEVTTCPRLATCGRGTALTTTKACTRRLLKKLQENIELVRLKIKSRSISVVMGSCQSTISTLVRSPYQQWLRNQSKVWDWHDASLRDTAHVDQIREDAISGLKTIDKTLLSCLQFGLLPNLYSLCLSTRSHSLL